MKSLRDYIQTLPLCADGAAGTYLYSIAGRGSIPCELLNVTEPDTVMQMHRRYVEAGARLILTNTFTAPYAAAVTGGSVSEIIREGVTLARQAAGDIAHVCADIGQLPDNISSIDAYLTEADVFIDEGINTFMFETFSDSDIVIRVAEHIRSKKPDAFLIASFAVSPEGLSRSGKKGQSLIDDIIASRMFDGAGFNCACGPFHLLTFASKVSFGPLIPVIRPNAGYPRRNEHPDQRNDRFPGSPEYFARILSSATDNGFRIMGGCCGTSPDHIRMLAEMMGKHTQKGTPVISIAATERQSPKNGSNAFADAINGKSSSVFVAELEPPFNADIGTFDSASRILAMAGFDAITVADSPMSRVRADSVLCAARVSRLNGIQTIPHICCRDRNTNAIRSALIAAHTEGIRNVLVITGDPVPEEDRSSVKSVFNLSSVKLCRYIGILNDELFPDDPILYGCAFNANAGNISAELAHLRHKIDEGASFILTQPVFSEKAADAIARAREFGITSLAGVYIPVSFRNTVFLANEMPGFDIPDHIIRKFSPEMTREEGERMGIEIAYNTAETLSTRSDGFYFMTPFNRANITATLLTRLRNRQ